MKLQASSGRREIRSCSSIIMPGQAEVVMRHDMNSTGLQLSQGTKMWFVNVCRSCCGRNVSVSCTHTESQQNSCQQNHLRIGFIISCYRTKALKAVNFFLRTTAGDVSDGWTASVHGGKEVVCYFVRNVEVIICTCSFWRRENDCEIMKLHILNSWSSAVRKTLLQKQFPVVEICERHSSPLWKSPWI